ncbi:zinc-dependent metalloproteinase lipoprotein [uncultured Bacteroides sp.]|uniref:zinc-dependent metalloproteinase lipoprotein n=1 Tax=uncultured Bacteroides sp. TaxID=162156 RepID=UPI0025E1F846|nr:zinc-dependent metalloproteinase lipoprotein [uncultured Bacteroides sp.]
MKTKLILLFSLLWVLAGCSDSNSDSATIEISPSAFDNVSPEGATLKVSVKCNSAWRVSSNQNWCIPTLQEGSNNEELVLTVHANTTSKERSTTVTLMATKTSKTLRITQSPATATAGEHHYKLPVIFHVLYKDADNRMQYVDKGRLAQIINVCNLMYRNKIYQSSIHNTSQDMNLEFVMATEKPDGTALEEAGVERIKWEPIPMSCEQFMNGTSEQTKSHTAMLWNPKVYINIFVYPFSEDNVLGISHLPYCLSSHPLDGLHNGNYYLNHEVGYPHCVSVNSKYIYTNGDETYYNTSDVYNTLAHELGHYLGLHHVFSEDGDNTDLCKDSDYCTDTPTYNMTEYTSLMKGIEDFSKYSFDDLCTRTNCETGDTFISHNIMDYAFCYSDRFTPQQRKRIRHVLSYSPLIPGAKAYTSADTRSLSCDEQPPIQFRY